MKKIYFLLLYIFISLSSWATVYNLGYSSNEIKQGIGSGNQWEAVILQGAIQLPTTTMGKFTGDSITHISIGLHSDGMVPYNQFTVFIRSALQGSGTLLYSQRVKTVKLGDWNVVELDTPFKITGEEIFVGYLITTTGSVMGTDGDLAADARGCWTKDGNEEWTVVQGFGNLSIRAMVSSGEDMYEDVTANRASAPMYTRPGAEFPVSVDVTNSGLLPITQLEVVCEDKGEVIRKDTIRNLEIYYGQKARFMMEGLSLQEIGMHKLNIVIASVNGGKLDAMPADNVVSTLIDITENCAERTMLLDHFTTEACPNCPKGAAFMKKVVAGYEDRVAWIAHHSGFYTDQFTLPESESLMVFYNSATTYAPAFMFDRINFEEMGAQGGSGGPIMNTTGQTVESMQAMIKSRLSSYSPVELAIEGTFDQQTRLLEFDINYRKLQEIGSAQGLLCICLVEDGIKTFGQSGAVGEYIHNNLIRYFYDSALGISFDGANTSFTRHYTHTLPLEWNHANVKVVAFVSNYSPTDINGLNVCNAVVKPLSEISTGIDEVTTNSYRVRVIKQEIVIEGEYDSFAVFDSKGNRAVPKSLTSGIYIVCVTANGKVGSHKCIVE